MQYVPESDSFSESRVQIRVLIHHRVVARTSVEIDVGRAKRRDETYNVEVDGSWRTNQ